MEKGFIIFNPKSGKNKSQRIALFALERLNALYAREKGEMCFSIAKTRKGLKVVTLIKRKSLDENSLIVGIGGDGTLNQVATGIMESELKIPLGIIPGGTVNNFSRNLNIPLDHQQAVEVIMEGNKRGVDIGRVNDSYMLSTLTIGLLADLAVRKYSGKNFFRYIRRIIRFINNRKYHLRIEHDEGVWEGKTRICLVTMSNSAAGFTNLNPEAAPDDGFFHLYLSSDKSPFRYFKFLPYFVMGKIKNSPEIEYIKSRKLKITSNEEIRSRIDGDPGEAVPLHMEVMEKYLEVIVGAESLK